MRGAVLLSAAMIVGGVAGVAAAVAEGGAQLDLVVIFPVVSGSSGLFLVGVLLLVAGFFSLPFTLASRPGDGAPDDGPEGPSAGPPSPGGSGGVVVIGPVPIFFGAWRGASRRAVWTAVALGVGVTIAGVALYLALR